MAFAKAYVDQCRHRRRLIMPIIRVFRRFAVDGGDRVATEPSNVEVKSVVQNSVLGSKIKIVRN